MKAIRLVAQTGTHPAYNRKAARAAKAAGQSYHIQPTITYDAGTECDHPHCWIHCCTPQPTMAPADDECANKVHEFLNHPRRKAQLRRLKNMASPALFAKLPEDLKTYVKTLSEKWADQLAEVDAADERPDVPTDVDDTDVDDTELTFEQLDSLTS